MDSRHPKRSFLKHRPIDSPAYDASEEDNDPLTDDGASVTSLPSPTTRAPPVRPRPADAGPGTKPYSRAKHQLAASLTLSSDDGIDSPTYDGDVESSTTIGGQAAPGFRPSFSSALSESTSASVSALTSPSSVPSSLPESTLKPDPANPTNESTPSGSPSEEARTLELKAQSIPFCVPGEPAPAKVAQEAFDPAKLTPEDIQAFVSKAITGESHRPYTINKPPTDRPVRIYADGVYDLFHFGHALQLRQAKMSFPSVYLLVGVCSDELVREHKNPCVMNHAERCEAIRHCRWVDQVVPEAPWVITPDFVEKYSIDYVAHDEDPYGSAGHDDVYGPFKQTGQFLPTRRTPGVSTSELLERIVKQYRHRDFDGKLEKMGRGELKAEGSDYDDDPDNPRSRAVSRVRGRKEQLKQEAR